MNTIDNWNPDVPGPWTSCQFKNKVGNTCKQAGECLREKWGDNCINGGTFKSSLLELSGDMSNTISQLK